MNFRLALVLIACFAVTYVTAQESKYPLKKHPNSKKWDQLFDEQLSNAVYPEGVWSLANGEFTATEDQFL